MLIALLLILLIWRRSAGGLAPTSGLRAWLLVGSLCGLSVAAWSLVVPFDTADAAAREIHRRGLTNRHWMAFPDSRAQGVSALTGIRFRRAEADCMQSFVRWNYQSKLHTPAQLSKYLTSEVAKHGRFYLLSDISLSAVLSPRLLRQLVHIPAGYDGQDYYLFVVGPNLPDMNTRMPNCVAEQRPLLAVRPASATRV
jgi:hypothetical protein